jgi:hypothetical protein
VVSLKTTTASTCMWSVESAFFIKILYLNLASYLEIMSIINYILSNYTYNMYVAAKAKYFYSTVH